jgi:hypothetical protein
MNLGRPNDKIEVMQTEVLIHYFKVTLWSFNDDISAEEMMCKCIEWDKFIVTVE